MQVIIECAAVYDREEHEIEVEAFAEAVIGYLKNKGVDLADPDWALGAPRRPTRRKHRADTGAMLLASDAARASRSFLIRRRVDPVFVAARRRPHALQLPAVRRPQGDDR